MKKLYLTLCLGLLGLAPNLTKAQTLEVDKDYKRNRQAVSAKASASPNASVSFTPQNCGYNYIIKKARDKGFNDALYESEINKIIEKIK